MDWFSAARASTPLATGTVRYCHCGMCGVETHTEGRGQRGGCCVFRAMGLAWDASCNTKPVMEVWAEAAIDVAWDCVSPRQADQHKHSPRHVRATARRAARQNLHTMSVTAKGRTHVMVSLLFSITTRDCNSNEKQKSSQSLDFFLLAVSEWTEWSNPQIVTNHWCKYHPVTQSHIHSLNQRSSSLTGSVLRSPVDV